MRIPKLRGTIALSAFAAAALLAPVRFSTAEAMIPATAECTTCCSAAGQLCVVCAQACLTVADSYDNGNGPCPS
ncbi:hypothetical protein [Longimicrobium sp.]|jgi:hypothetical protein|uniref:hypothetical protein n=1 Tax=Longimicrobium sp. TaxID=2029185 RepID=UPI002EDA0630